MSARIGDDMPQTKAALRARVLELQEHVVALQARVDDLTFQRDAARQTVGAEQRANRAHALECRVVRRPAGGWPPIPAVDDVPTGGAT